MRTRSYRAFQVDAFTRTLFSGNPAGVVLDADDLSDDEMQKLARELGRGDTAFICQATGEDHDLRMPHTGKLNALMWTAAPSSGTQMCCPTKVPVLDKASVAPST